MLTPASSANAKPKPKVELAGSSSRPQNPQAWIDSMNQDQAKKRITGRSNKQKKGRTIKWLLMTIVVISVACWLITSYGGAAPANAASEHLAPPQKIDVALQAEVRSDGVPGVVTAGTMNAGDTLHYIPVSEIKLPKNGTPLKLHCLLRAELDPYTFSRWEQQGIITNREYIVKFKPVVTIKNEADRDLLFDWHVEAVSIDTQHNPSVAANTATRISPHN